ncbi:MAG: CBS domain-containing protein [Polyangiaceae bacterium]|nr:CBS domain-containing protein [Polyangiaceae bacterium]
MLGRYLGAPLTPAQRELLRDAIGGLRVETLGGARIGIVSLDRPRGIEGVDEVASEVLALHDVHALFVLVRIGAKRVQVIARSRTTFVDVARAVRAIGGGGHVTAASGVAKHSDAAAVELELLAALAAAPPIPRTVGELMSSPAATVRPEFPLASLAPLLAHHHGLPVVDRGKLVGVVSRRDLERAQREQLLHRPVSTVMTRDVITTTQETPVEDAIEAMSHADVGRLPVMRDGELVGVIARSDVLASLYGEEQSAPRP